MTTAYFAACPKGLEELLARELSDLGAQNIKQTIAGVHFEGDVATCYRALLHSRLASRIMQPLAQFEATGQDSLYKGVKVLKWPSLFDVEKTILVDASVNRSKINHSQFAAQKIKDAIADCFREAVGKRPSVDKDRPDIRISVSIKRDVVRIALDLSGEALHQRGYRRSAGSAPLKENLAAAVLLRAGWPAIAEKGGCMVDPLCGSGTFLVEAFLMAADMAPGLLRSRFGVFATTGFDTGVWSRIRQEAEARRDKGLLRLEQSGLSFTGYDGDVKVLDHARMNIKRAGLEGKIKVMRRDLRQWLKDDPFPASPGLVITNPPYGERLGSLSELTALYQVLGNALKKCFEGWQASIFTGTPGLGKQLGYRAEKRYKLFNGSLPCELLNIQITPDWEMRRSGEQLELADGGKAVLSAGAEMFRNRLKKNMKHLGKWARREGFQAWRLYDADLPEYNVAIDLYGDHIVIQEYQAPVDIPADKVERRLHEVLLVTPEVAGIARENVVLKQRRRQRGSDQYTRMDRKERFLEIGEKDLSFLVNLWDYLDTGLFNDHRPVRQMIRDKAKDKRFLNLFAYTGAATVYAAAGGARATTTVDLSRTYTDWAKRNMALNGFDGAQHQFLVDDCLSWLSRCRERFDLIFLDPPTFSNSKKLDRDFEVERDQIQVIGAAAKLLARDGLLIFSTNHRGFKLDEKGLVDMGLAFQDISAKTIPKDFSRKSKIHQCWKITAG